MITSQGDTAPKLREDIPRGFGYRQEHAMLYFHIEDSEDLAYAVRLYKYDWMTAYRVGFELSPDIRSLASMSSFEAYLSSLSRCNAELSIDGGEALEDWITPDALPEASYN